MKESEEIYSKSKNKVNKMIRTYSYKPLVVTDYKIPDHLSLNPLYYAIISNELKNNSASLNEISLSDSTNYSSNLNKGRYFKYPIWNNQGTNSYKLRDSNFQQPWYKNKKINKITPNNLNLSSNNELYKMIYGN